MAKVILICGKLCSGKSTYAERMVVQDNAVLLSVDEIMLALFGQPCGEKHDEYVVKIKNYLFDKSFEFLDKGFTVILDWGFWTKKERDYAREFYNNCNIECEVHYIDIDYNNWYEYIKKRNNSLIDKGTSAHYVDENLMAKFFDIFEEPSKDEIDVWLKEVQ